MDKSTEIVSEESLKIMEQWDNWQDHYHSSCISRDSDILDIIELLDKTRKNWQDSVEECNRLKLKIEILEREKSVAEIGDNKPACKNDMFTMSRALIRRSVSDSNLIQEKMRTPKSRVKVPVESAFDILSAPLPCIPFSHTPQKQKQTVRPRLADFCPDSRPQVPALLIRCVFALEKCFLNKEGLYRIPGNEAEVTRLMDSLSSRYVPNMTKWDPDTITGCIKKFLHGLREALIPVSSFKEFVRAAKNESKPQLISLVNGLPIPNRDTLSFMCAHLQKVASNSVVNKMSIENLATMLGQTIVGPVRIVKKPPVQFRGRTTDESEESQEQRNVLLHLLQLDDFWIKYNEMPLDMPPYRGLKRNA